jgi:hypothetical protein
MDKAAYEVIPPALRGDDGKELLQMPTGGIFTGFIGAIGEDGHTDYIPAAMFDKLQKAGEVLKQKNVSDHTYIFPTLHKEAAPGEVVDLDGEYLNFEPVKGDVKNADNPKPEPGPDSTPGTRDS